MHGTKEKAREIYNNFSEKYETNLDEPIMQVEKDAIKAFAILSVEMIIEELAELSEAYEFELGGYNKEFWEEVIKDLKWGTF